MAHRRKSKQPGFDFSALTFDFGFGPIDDPTADENHDNGVRDLLKTARLSPAPAVFQNAVEMAKTIDLTADYFALVPGSFVFGDLLEALCLKRALRPQRLYVTTLGLSPDNVDSLVNIHDYLHCSEVNLIVSSYYASVERNKNIPYIAQEFGGRNMNLAVCANHAKIALFERSGEGGDFIIFGSANLASSANLEVFAIIHDEAVVDFCRKLLQGIMNRWTVIRGSTREMVFTNNTGNRNTDLFQTVQSFITPGGDTDGTTQ